MYASELKYLGVHITAAKHLKFSVEHLRLRFYRMFNCIFSKSKAANSEMVIRTLENCINRAMHRIFGACDKCSLEYTTSCVSLDNNYEIYD